MKTLLCFVVGVGALLTLGCNQSGGATSGNLVGLHDIVLVDDPAGNGQVASLSADGGTIGVPHNLLFATSADTNEIRLLRMFVPRIGKTHQWARAPNPLETLSIPTLDRPTLLATDVGINANYQRVTANHVYASRPGAQEISIVSVSQLRQLGRRPMPIPGPLTAMTGLMTVGAGDLLPASTSLYFATWDGKWARLFRTEVSVTDTEVESTITAGTSAFESLELLEGAPIATLFALLPLTGRSVDGAAFCASEMCLVVAIKPSASGAGRTYVLEPSTGKRVPVAFPGPVRLLATSAIPGALYGVLDEAACGGLACAGVVAANLTNGTNAGGFPQLSAVPGPTFGPLRPGTSLITGLDVARNVTVPVLAELLDGGTYDSSLTFPEVGAFTTSDGYLSFFDSVSGGLIDYDQRRAAITGAAERLPIVLEDGGTVLFAADGGEVGSLVTATVTTSIPLDGGVELPYRVSTVTVDGADAGASWVFDISDGYLGDQSIVISNRGQIPGLVALPTSASAGTRLVTSGYEARAVVGDRVQLAEGDLNDGGFSFCGAATVVAIGSGYVEVDAIPEGCAQPSVFSVLPGDSLPLVITASLDGYLGRSSPGATFTYDKAPIAYPLGIDRQRTALTVTMAQLPPERQDAYMSFAVGSRLSLFRNSLNTVGGSSITGSLGLSACASSVATQVILGTTMFTDVPFDDYVGFVPYYHQRVLAAVQSGNAVLELRPDSWPAPYQIDSQFGSAVCYH